MKLKIIGSLTKELHQKLASIHFEFTELSSDADYVVITSKVGSYFLNTTMGRVIEEAYTLEFTVGKPLVLSEKDFLKQKFIQIKENQV